MTMDTPAPDTEDNKYDLLIEGTGLTQSILAAAVSRLGKKVIHIDKNTFYGSYWSALSIDQLDEFVKKYSSKGHFPGSGKLFLLLCYYTHRFYPPCLSVVTVVLTTCMEINT